MFTKFCGRQAVQLENDKVRVTVLTGGGHIAEILLKQEQVNPLWQPPWRSMEPSEFDPRRHQEYGNDAESRLLAGIMGHNLCFDFYGGPSEQEAAAGLTVHGEAPVANWEVLRPATGELQAAVELPVSQTRFERRIRLAGDGTVLAIEEKAENLSASDRAVGWNQHVTIGPPFLAPGRTTINTPGTRSKVFETDFSNGKGHMKIGAEFEWPWCPDAHGGRIDLRETTTAPVSAGFTTHLMDTSTEDAWFTAYNPEMKVAFGYIWQRSDFPWLGIWEENHCREHAPWNGRTFCRGLEFSVSPMPESRRQMIGRGSLFGVPGYRWIPARSSVTVEYYAFLRTAKKPPQGVERKGAEIVLI